VTHADDWSGAGEMKPRPTWPSAKTLADCLPGQYVWLREQGGIVQVARVTKLGETWVRYAEHAGQTCCPHQADPQTACVNASMDEESAA
jgi:hypothetical protein